MITLRYLSNIIIAIFLLYLLLDSKYGKKKTLTILIPAWAGIILENFIFIYFIGYESFYLYYPLLVHLPSFVLFFIISKQRGLKLIFTLLTVIVFSIIISIMGSVFSNLFDGSILLEIVGRLITFALMYLVIKTKFRDLYLNMLNTTNKGWGLFCIIPLCAYAIFYYLYMLKTLTYSEEGLFIMLVSVVAITATYLITMNFFRLIQEQHLQAIQQQQIRDHLESVKRQYAAVAESEEKMEILRHDMRHVIKNISSLLSSGDTAAALEFLSKQDTAYKKAAIKKYCENTTINAILSYYFNMLEEDGIALQYKICLPKEIGIDEMDLSTVFANALENARIAVGKLPAEQRKIEITCLYSPQFIIEISNPYDGTILMDKNNMPTSAVKGHGVGTRSIKVFADKHNAVLDYKVSEKIFQLRILIPLTPIKTI